MSRGDFRTMRLILMFDLPTTTKQDIKVYTEFKRWLKFFGYSMMQESVYTRICINNSEYLKQMQRLANHTPANGDVRVIKLTENQFQNIMILVGHKSDRDEVETSEALTIIE